MRTTTRQIGLFALALSAAHSAHADDAMTDATLLEASLRQQWLGIDQQVQLRRVDQEALAASSAYQQGASAPSPTQGQDGRVMFEFGRVTPKIICTPFRICDVELQAGERVQGAPMVGDGDGWIIEPAFAGGTPHVVIKPKISGISTNLAIYTDRRVYHLELQSMPTEHMPFVAFAYPEDRQAKWMALAQQRGLVGGDGAGGQRDTTSGEYELSMRPDSLNFNYRTKREGRWLVRRKIDWEPKRVYDDGEKTIIEMPRKILARELPVLFVREKDGKDKIVNYRVKGTHFIVDRLFDHASMVKGVGWLRQERVGIYSEED